MLNLLKACISIEKQSEKKVLILANSLVYKIPFRILHSSKF